MQPWQPRTDVAPIGTVRTLRTDNGGEYVGSDFKELMLKHRAKHEHVSKISSVTYRQ